MNHHEIEELLGAYALDAVDPDERVLIEGHLADCARCRAEVEQHREVATLLAHTGGNAPAGVWQRIADSLEEQPAVARVTQLEPRRTRRVLAPALAAAAVVVIALLGVRLGVQDRRIDQLQAALDDPLVPALQAALEDPGSRLFELTSADNQLAIRGVITEDGIGYLRASALPRLAPQRTYQLWGAAGDELVSLGVLGAEPDVVSFGGGAYAALAITEEMAPGVVMSDHPPVVAGSLT